MTRRQEPGPEASTDGSSRGRRLGWMVVAIGLLVVVGAVVVTLTRGSDTSRTTTLPPPNSGKPGPPPPEGVPADRVAVGPGAVESSIRQVVRTLDGRVYIAAPDDDGAVRNGFSTPTILRMYRATTTGIPTKFAVADAAHSPRANPPGTMSGGDARLDRAGVIHLVYYLTGAHETVAQTFSTVSDTWGPPEVVTRFGALNGNAQYGARAAALNALALSRDGTPFVVFAGATGVRGFHRTATGWVEDGDLSTVSSLHPTVTFDRQDRLHVAWLEGEHTIRYAMRDASGHWSTPETVATGAPAVLSNGGGDQSPSITVDATDQPMVVYL